MLQVAFIGDSISVGYTTYALGELSKAIGQPFESQGKPIGGMQLTSFHHQLPTVGVSKNPDIIVIMGGTNDAAGGITGSEVAARLAAFIDKAKAKFPFAKYIIAEPPPVASFRKYAGVLDQYRGMMPGVAASKGASISRTPLTVEDLSLDGIHPNISGYKKIAFSIGTSVKEVAGEKSAEEKEKIKQSSYGTVLAAGVGLGILGLLVMVSKR